MCTRWRGRVDAQQVGPQTDILSHTFALPFEDMYCSGDLPCDWNWTWLCTDQFCRRFWSLPAKLLEREQANCQCHCVSSSWVACRYFFLVQRLRRHSKRKGSVIVRLLKEESDGIFRHASSLASESC